MWKMAKYVYRTWFDPIGTRTHDLPTLEASTLTIALPMRVFGEYFRSVSQRIHILSRDGSRISN